MATKPDLANLVLMHLLWLELSGGRRVGREKTSWLKIPSQWYFQCTFGLMIPGHKLSCILKLQKRNQIWFSGMAKARCVFQLSCLWMLCGWMWGKELICRGCDWFNWAHDVQFQFLCCAQDSLTLQKPTDHSDGTARAGWPCPWMSVPFGAAEGGRVLQLLSISRSIFVSSGHSIKSELGQSCYVPFYLLCHWERKIC